MPRKPKATMETPSDAAAESAAPAPKERAASKKPTATTRAASPAKSAAQRANKTSPPAPSAEDTPKRAVKSKPTKTSLPAAKSNGTSAASRAAKAAALDASSYHDGIARLAYRFWEERGRAEGSPEEDWLRAERELRRTDLAERV